MGTVVEPVSMVASRLDVQRELLHAIVRNLLMIMEQLRERVFSEL